MGMRKQTVVIRDMQQQLQSCYVSTSGCRDGNQNPFIPPGSFTSAIIS
jgi:hypothetical protein